MAYRHTKRGSTSLAVREMQIKTTMRHHVTPVRMTVINKQTNNKCQQGCGEKGTPVHYWWECRLVQPLWKTVQKSLKKLKRGLPFDSVIPQLGLYPKNPGTPIPKNLCTQCSQQRYLQQPRAGNSLNAHQQISGSENCVHLHNGILHRRKKEGTPTFCDSMSGTGEYYAK